MDESSGEAGRRGGEEAGTNRSPSPSCIPALPPLRVEPYEIEWRAGFVRGYRWRGGSNWVVLVHGPGEDLDAWGDVPATLAGAGYSVAVVDLPGHGLSDDPWEAERADELMAVLVGGVRAMGARRCFLAVAGELAEAAVRAAGVEAAVVVSPAAPTAEASGATPPVLVMVGGLERRAVAAANRFFRWTRGWAVMSSLGTEKQGTAVFRSEWAMQAKEQMLGFFRDYRVVEIEER
jgi:pimeloyl-ACP methyl ester carboxylesterase